MAKWMFYLVAGLMLAAICAQAGDKKVALIKLDAADQAEYKKLSIEFEKAAAALDECEKKLSEKYLKGKSEDYGISEDYQFLVPTGSTSVATVLWGDSAHSTLAYPRNAIGSLAYDSGVHSYRTHGPFTHLHGQRERVLRGGKTARLTIGGREGSSLGYSTVLTPATVR